MKKYARGDRVDYAGDLERAVRKKTYRPRVRQTETGDWEDVPSKTGVKKIADDLGRVMLGTGATYAMPFAAMASGAVNAKRALGERLMPEDLPTGYLRQPRSKSTSKPRSKSTSKPTKKAKGGYVTKADGVAKRGKTKGRFV